MSKHPSHDAPGESGFPMPGGRPYPSSGDGPAAAGVSRPQALDAAGALARLGRLIAALDAAAASLQEARRADAIPGLIGARLHALGIESQVALLDEPVDNMWDGGERAFAETTLRLCYVSLAPELLRQVERITARPLVGMTFSLAHVTTLMDVVRTHQARYLEEPEHLIREMIPWLPDSGARQLSQVVRAAKAVVAPLLSRGRVLGVMSVWADDLRPEDVPVLAAFARQAGTALDNARLDRDVAQHTRRLEKLVEIGRDMTATLEMEEVLTRVVSGAAQALDTNHAVLWLVEDQAEATSQGTSWPLGMPFVRLGAMSGISNMHTHLGETLAHTGELPVTPVVRVVETLRTELYSDVESAPPDMLPAGLRRFLLEEGYRGLLVAPVLTSANEAVGAIVVYSRAAGALTAEDGTYLEAIGRLVAGAIKQARLFHQVATGRALMEAVFSSYPAAIAVVQWPEDVVRMANPRLRAWSAQPDCDPVGQTIHELYPHTRISLVNGLSATLEGVRHTRQMLTVRGVVLRDAQGEPQRVVTLNVAPIQMVHEGEGERQGFGDGSAPAPSTQGVLAEPTLDEGLLLIMWDTTAHMQAETKLAAQMRRGETLSAVATALESERELPALLRRIAKAARELTGADVAGFLLRAAPEAPFEVVALTGTDGRTATALRRVLVPSQKLLRSLLEGRQPLLAGDISTMLNRSDARIFEQAKLYSFAATPLIASDGWTMGALVVGHHDRGSFTQEHSDLLAGLAAQAGAVIERTQALEEARRRADELEATFTSMADGVAIYDARGRLMRMNAAAQRITGYHAMVVGNDAAQLRDRVVMRLPSGEPVEPEDMPSERAVRGETFHAVEYLVDGEDGRNTLVSATGAPLKGLDGSIRGGVVIVRNVTQLRRLERRTQEALDALLGIAGTLVAPPEPDATPLGAEADTEQAELHGTLHHLCQLAIGVLGCDRVGIMLVDPETHLMTPGAAAGLNAEHDAEWQRRQRVGGVWRRVEESLPPAIARRFLDGEAVTLDYSQPPYGEGLNAFGAQVVLALPMRVEDRLVGMLVVEHCPKQTNEPPHVYTPEEAALAEGVARLAALAVERQRLMRVAAEVEALRTANALKQEFLSIASHELKTPLTVLQARTQATQRRLVRMGQTEAAAQFAPVQESLDRMLALIQELLDASRIEAGRLELQSEPCDVGALAVQAVREAREASDRTITLEGADAPNLWTRGDQDRLMQVLANLISNALKYSPPDTPVAMRVWRQPAPVRAAGGAAAGEVLVSVSDQGIGIPRDEVGQVFTRFYRARTSSPRQYGGLGLGLHIAATIVERHGGRIWAESAGPNGGSTFTVALPALDV